MTRAMQDVLTKRAKVDEETARRLNELKELELEILKQRREEGCKCAPWKYSKVGAALKELSKKHQDLSWSYESWLWHRR